MALTIQERLKDLRLSDEMIDLLKFGRLFQQPGTSRHRRYD